MIQEVVLDVVCFGVEVSSHSSSAQQQIKGKHTHSHSSFN
jgi:hypothetical protein